MGEHRGSGEPNREPTDTDARRRQATTSHYRVQLNSASGAAQRHLATCRKCLLSSRPQVRILLGAHLGYHFSLLCSRPGSQQGSQSLRTAANEGSPKQPDQMRVGALWPPLIATSSLAIGAMATSRGLRSRLAVPLRAFGLMQLGAAMAKSCIHLPQSRTAAVRRIRRLAPVQAGRMGGC
jgi:hypothetical protein